MSDYSLIPVDHQPDFGDVSLVPVEHDPFDGDDVTPPAQPKSPTTGVSPANLGAPANSTQASEAGESWNPDSENNVIPGSNPSTASTLPPNNAPFKPFGELKPATLAPTQRIGNMAADVATALGMQPYTANDLAKRIGNVLGLAPPLAVTGSALDLIDANHRGDLPGAITAAAGMIPGAKGVARDVVEASAASVANKLNRYLLDPEHISGGPKAKWFEQALGFTRENAADLAKQLVFDESQAVQTVVTQHGRKFDQTINVAGVNGRTIPVRSIWIVQSDGVPRLVTVLPRS
jgi:hypothetical protein